MSVRPEDIKEVEATIRKYMWVCPVCGRVISSYTRSMVLKYAKLHVATKHKIEAEGQRGHSSRAT
jgi:hypothetical protein